MVKKALRQWLLSVGRYQRGIAIVALETSLKRAAWWKRIGLLFVLLPVISVTLSDLPSDVETEYGVKAATCALGAAACVFIGLIPTALETRRLDYMIQFIGGSFAILTGVFWLLSSTGGRLWRYMLAVVPIVIGMFIGMVSLVVIGEMWKWEGTYLKARKMVRDQEEDENTEVS